MRNFFLIGLGFMTSSLWAQVYEFESIIDIDATTVKSQGVTGTCWSFSTTSFIESELLRMGKGEHDLSEMYNVRMVYPEKASKYVRFQGKNQFSQGSLAHDVIWSADQFGLVPESIYSGKTEGSDIHNHDEMENILKSTLDVVLKEKTVSNTWQLAFNGILDAYLGMTPETFTYQDKEYTPQSFANAVGFKGDDYVSISSFTHHSFYKDFILEVPDNFSRGSFENVPLKELVEIIDYALDNGFTLAWDGDVSERGFSSKEGLAILPESGVTKEDLFKTIVKEEKVTQKKRQVSFDNQKTTDDHLMHITGKLKDQNGTVYYKIKNSWGDSRGNKGYIYMSLPYLQMKTVSVLLHKDGIPKSIAKKIL